MALDHKNKQTSSRMHNRKSLKKGAGFSVSQILRIGTLGLSFLLMLIALLLFGTVVRKDIVKMTVKISVDGFRVLVERLEKVVDDLSRPIVAELKEKLRQTEEELRTVKEELHTVKEELNKVKQTLENPFKKPNWLPGRRRRELRVGRTDIAFDVAVRPLTIANLDKLNDIPILGMMIKVFANLVLNLGTFPLLALVLLVIFACFLYLCKIFGRLFCYIVRMKKSAPAKKGSRFLRYLSILFFTISFVRELIWAVTVGFITFVLLFICAGAWWLLSKGNWTNCWLGLMTIDFTRGAGIMQIKVASVCAFIAIVLNLIDQLVDIIWPATRHGKAVVARDQEKDEQALWVSKSNTYRN